MLDPDSATILVGVDGSSCSMEALTWATAVGSRLDIPVTAAMAWQYPAGSPVPGAVVPDRDAAEMDIHVINRLKQMIAESDLGNVAYKALRGPAHEALKIASASPNVKMLVVATRGLGPIKGIMLGSVSRKLLFSTVRPLVVVPANSGRPQLDRIVVGLDGSAISESVAAWSAGLCANIGAAATVLRCIDAGSERSPEQLEDVMVRAQLLFEDDCYCHVFRGLQVNHRPVVSNGDPRRCLIETAQSENADLIVVGQRGVGQFNGLGGTTSYLAHHSPLPLAIIPQSSDV